MGMKPTPHAGRFQMALLAAQSVRITKKMFHFRQCNDRFANRWQRMSDPKKTKYNPQGSYYVEALWHELRRSLGRGKCKIVMNDDRLETGAANTNSEFNPAVSSGH
jgi:hypothetical protein